METGTKLDLFPVKIPFYREDRDTTVPVTQCNELCIVTLMGRSWVSFGCDVPRTTATVTEQDYVAFFHQYFGFTNNPALAPTRNAPVSGT